LGFLVLANCIFIGVEVDEPDSSHWLIASASIIFLIIFACEQTCRIIILGPMFLQSWINVVDATVIFVSIFSRIFKAAEYDNFFTNNPSIFTIVRILRLVRMAKVFTQFKSEKSVFKELGVMVLAFVAALKKCLWVVAFLLVVLYIFALVGRSWIGLDSELGSQTQDHFGTVPRSIVTMFQVLSQDGWTDLSRDIASVKKETYIFFVLWIMFGNMGVLNLLTAVFVDVLLEAKEEMKEQEEKKALASRLKKIGQIGDIFAAMDTDGSGTLSADEMNHCTDVLKSKEFEGVFEELEMDASTFAKIIEFFASQMLKPDEANEGDEDNIDADGDGEVDYKEFIEKLAQMDQEVIKTEQWRLHTELAKVKAGTDALLGMLQRMANDPITSRNSRRTAMLGHNKDKKALDCISEWEVRDVTDWLATHGFNQVHMHNFEDHQITGDVLVVLSEDDLMELGINTPKEKKQFYKELDNLIIEEGELS